MTYVQYNFLSFFEIYIVRIIQKEFVIILRFNQEQIIFTLYLLLSFFPILVKGSDSFLKQIHT